MLMRSNYLQLQKLYRDPEGINANYRTSKKYDELLAESENHREIDDRIARVFAHGLTSRAPTALKAFMLFNGSHCAF